jgi:hypothetical protein
VTSRSWWIVAGALIIAFLARAPLYLSVLPPFEGWDEYQHLAYIVHLDESGTIPVFDERLRVPLSLRPVLVAEPQSPAGAEQLREWGAVSYDEYWNKPRPALIEPPPSSPRLYQAQQPPLAYMLALPVWRALKTSPLAAIAAIRSLNVLLVAAALTLFAAALARLVPPFAPRVAVFALVCLHPLFFQNVARVANDGLAVATGLAGISLLVLADRRTLLTRTLLAAACLAASVWSKQTSLTLIPALIVGPLATGWVHGIPSRQCLRVTALAGVAFAVLVAPLWMWSFQHYGTLLTTQDSVELAARGSTVATLATTLVTMAWRPVVEFLFVPGRPWVGGWSFVPMHETLGALYGGYWTAMLAGAVAGGIVSIWQRPRTIPGDLAVCAAVVAFTAAGMTYHAVLSHAAFGRTMTTPWYFMTALPFLFVLVVRGLAAMSARVSVGVAAALAILLVLIELHGTWMTMPAFYTSTSRVGLQWSRLTSMHPGILSGAWRGWFLGMQIGALGLVAGALVYASRTATGRMEGVSP